MPFACQHSHEPPQLSVPSGGILPVKRPHPTFDELTSCPQFVLVAELGEGLLGHRTVNALGSKFPAKSRFRETFGGEATSDPHLGKVNVVDEADVFEAVEQRRSHVLWDTSLPEFHRELMLAPRPQRELPEEDRSGDRLGVGLAVLLRVDSTQGLLAVDSLEPRLLLGGLADPDTELLLDEPLELIRKLWVVAEEPSRILHALAELVAVVSEP